MVGGRAMICGLAPTSKGVQFEDVHAMKEIRPSFERHHFTLYHADCLDVLSQLPENSVDMAFADPPYFLSSGTFTCQNGRMVPVKKADWDLSRGLQADFEFQRAWIGAVRRVLKPEGTLWVSGTYHSIYQCGMAIQLAGFKILNDIAWYKPNASPNLSCRYFTASHETLIWAVKDPKAKHKFNYRLMKERDWPRDSLKRPHLQMRSVWSIGTPRPTEKAFGKHPTQKPIDLLQRIVLASTLPGDLVLDPFTGSSTTGLAAYFYDREFIGIDVEQQYLDLSVKRFRNLEALMRRKPEHYKVSSEEQLASCVQEPGDMYGLYSDNGDKSHKVITRHKQSKQ
jgi:site-specific DNA-methyltransferase (adenine-specific)